MTVTTGYHGRDARHAVERSLDAIDRHDTAVGAFVDFTIAAAERDLAAAEVELSAGRRRGPLHGVPIAVKELFDVADADGSYGSNVLADRRAPADAAVVASLRRAGAVVVGTTRAHEFGWGITTQHATRGSTHNPWHLDRIPGGSSGGSAAAVAAGMVPLAVASDTGGSVRIPAAFCGVFGLKTTPGRISRRGGVALAPTFDSVGFVAQHPALLAAALAATVGPDPGDPPTLDAPALAQAGAGDLVGVRFCVPEAAGGIAPTTAHVAALNTVSAALAELGGRQVEVSLPSGASLYEIFVPHQMAEAHHIHHAVLDIYPSQAASYGPDVRARLEAASAVTIVDYLEARRLASDARGRFLDAFTSVDLVVALVNPCGPSTVDNPNEVDVDGRSVPLRDAVMPSTVPQNIAGLPSVTVPAGLDADGLPIGVQISGRPWSEPLLLAVADALELAGACRAAIPNRFRTSDSDRTTQGA
jgi:aspartyl-tRNA(Asn)/glutamyl-tRNA(Gln) amidotransferase subunit A